MKDKVSLAVLPQGPLKVSGASAVTYCGEPVDADGDLFICRCGESKNPPFCDGSHKAHGFAGTSETPPTKELRVWEGQRLRTVFNPNTCMHVFHCKPLKELRARELEGDTEAAQEIMEVVQSCPSGALSYELKEKLDDPAVAEQPCGRVDIIEGGEVRITGAFEINAPLQERQLEGRATLCRCGRSQNKPWCDGRHRKREGFR